MITQVTTGTGICGNPFVVPHKGSSCILSLKVNRAQLPRNISQGLPIVCESSNKNECYRPPPKKN